MITDSTKAKKERKTIKVMRNYLVVLIILISACENKDNSVSLQVLNPNIETCIDSRFLEKATRIPEDVELYSIKNGDTVIILEMSHDYKDLYSQKWEIKFHDGLDSAKFDDFFYSHNSVVYNNASYKTDGVFVVRNCVNNMIFLCTITHYKEYDELYIIYYYPWKKHQYAPSFPIRCQYADPLGASLQSRCLWFKNFSWT